MIENDQIGEWNIDEEGGEDTPKRCRAGFWKPCLSGLIIGALCAGITLGVITTQYIQDSQKSMTSTVTTSTTTSTTSETTSTTTSTTSTTSDTTTTTTTVTTTTTSSTSTATTSTTSVTTTTTTSTTSVTTSTTTTSTTTTSATTVPLSLSGVLLDLDPNLLPGGWSLCYNATYSSEMNETVIATILSSCNQAKLLLGCRQVNNGTLNVAAIGSRADVLYNCSTISNCTNVVNGVGWYFSYSYSWGFVNGSDTVSRNSCDTGSTNSAYRLCWHTQGNGGYRCGTQTGLNSDTNWEKIIYHSN